MESLNNTKPAVIEYDVSVNDTFGQYAFWVVDFEGIAAINPNGQNASSFQVDTHNGQLLVEVNGKDYLFEVADTTLLEKLQYDGLLTIVSVPPDVDPEDENQSVQAYEISSKPPVFCQDKAA